MKLTCDSIELIFSHTFPTRSCRAWTILLLFFSSSYRICKLNWFPNPLCWLKRVKCMKGDAMWIEIQLKCIAIALHKDSNDMNTINDAHIAFRINIFINISPEKKKQQRAKSLWNAFDRITIFISIFATKLIKNGWWMCADTSTNYTMLFMCSEMNNLSINVRSHTDHVSSFELHFGPYAIVCRRCLSSLNSDLISVLIA